MKVIGFAFGLLLIPMGVFAQKEVPVPNLPPPPEGKAAVYFVRPSSAGSLINFSFFDSAACIGVFNGSKYIRYECDAGKHLFWARSENRDFLLAEVAAGKIYFVEAIPHMGAIKAGVSIEAVNYNDVKTVNRIFKMMNKRPPEFVTAADLQKWAVSTKDAVDRGLKKYAEEKASGATFPLLVKANFYPGK